MTGAKKTSCKVVSPFSTDEVYERHRLKVKEATSAVDLSPPKQRNHITYNAKKLQLQREREARILQENFILLRKLRDIMYRKKRGNTYERLKWQESRCIRSRAI